MTDQSVIVNAELFAVGIEGFASGSLGDVLPALKRRFDADGGEGVLVFEDETGSQVDFDLSGTLAEVLERAAPPKGRGPGRPKLGVTSREVSLLPRHWEWLEQQPNGISAALRRLVDQARKTEPGKERARLLRAALSRFMTAMAGNRPGYEEASRALFAGDQSRFEALVAKWPKDVREYALARSRAATQAASEG
jgi:uncharacterized protein